MAFVEKAKAFEMVLLIVVWSLFVFGISSKNTLRILCGILRFREEKYSMVVRYTTHRHGFLTCVEVGGLFYLRSVMQEAMTDVFRVYTKKKNRS